MNIPNETAQKFVSYLDDVCAILNHCADGCGDGTRAQQEIEASLIHLSEIQELLMKNILKDVADEHMIKWMLDDDYEL